MHCTAALRINSATQNVNALKRQFINVSGAWTWHKTRSSHSKC